MTNDAMTRITAALAGEGATLPQHLLNEFASELSDSGDVSPRVFYRKLDRYLGLAEDEAKAAKHEFVAYAPNGKEIRGQLHHIPVAVALIAHFKKPTGVVAEGQSDDEIIEWRGETDVNWDSQEPVKRGGELMYVDVDDECWPASQITFRSIE